MPVLRRKKKVRSTVRICQKPEKRRESVVLPTDILLFLFDRIQRSSKFFDVAAYINVLSGFLIALFEKKSIRSTPTAMGFQPSV
jgi:hypothetical protein